MLLTILLAVHLASSVVLCQVQRLTVTPDTVNVTQGSDVTLPCQVENRVGQVQWVKDGLTFGYDRSVPGFPRYSIEGNEANEEYNFKIANVR